MARFPTQINEVEAQWLTQSLHPAEVLAENAQVAGVDVEPTGMGI